MNKYLVLDYGGTAVKIAIMDKDANVYSEDEKPVPRGSLEKLKDLNREIAKEYEGQYKGVAISLPGIIDVDKGIAHTTSPYDVGYDVPLGAIYEEIYGVPVVIANDGKCAATAELKMGALKGVDSGVIVGLGTGIAGGIVINGKLWSGYRGSAGEISFLPNDYAQIIEAAKNPVANDDPAWGAYEDKCFSATYEYRASTNGLMRLWCKNMGVPFDREKYNGRLFFEKYDEGDEIAKATFEEFGWEVAVGMFSLQLTLDVEKFAIGGGISARPELIDHIRNCYSAVAKTQPDITADLDDPEIVACKYRNGANQVGALMYYLDKHPEA